MPRWNTPAIVAALSRPGRTVEVAPPGGDCATETLRVIHKDAGIDSGSGEQACLFLVGFNPGEMLPDGSDPANVEVSHIEVSDGLYSGGGLNTGDEATCVMYGEVCSALRKLGFVVVPSLSEYF